MKQSLSPFISFFLLCFKIIDCILKVEEKKKLKEVYSPALAVIVNPESYRPSLLSFAVHLPDFSEPKILGAVKAYAWHVCPFLPLLPPHHRNSWIWLVNPSIRSMAVGHMRSRLAMDVTGHSFLHLLNTLFTGPG